MKDRERGVVWEESIIFLPPAIKMVFLSATMSNATEFAEWICYLHKQPCHVVYTDFRPTPLQHYVFPIGGAGLYLVVDENEQFKEDNYLKMKETFSNQKTQISGGRGGGKASGRIAKGGAAQTGSDIYKIVKVSSRLTSLLSIYVVLSSFNCNSGVTILRLVSLNQILYDPADDYGAKISAGYYFQLQ